MLVFVLVPVVACVANINKKIIIPIQRSLLRFQTRRECLTKGRMCNVKKTSEQNIAVELMKLLWL